MIDNPWEEMSIGSKRRASMLQDIFWIREELRGEYGLKISLKKNSIKKNKFVDFKFRNIEFIKVPRNDDIVEWYLLLKEKGEWEIFLKLCNDLIDQVKRIQKEETMITIIINRLKRWQKLLMNNTSNQLSPEIQMGLYSELHSLLYYVSQHISLKEAIQLWGGPESDIQDFVLNEMAIEIKSHRSNRGEFVTISNPYQLYTVKKHFYLLVYSLSKTDKGETIDDVIEKIKKKLESDLLLQEIDVLNYKTAQYGYLDLLHKDNLIKYQIDKITLYEINEEFPKVNVEHIPEGIKNLKYQIDLMKCKEYKVTMDSLFCKEAK